MTIQNDVYKLQPKLRALDGWTITAGKEGSFSCVAIPSEKRGIVSSGDGPNHVFKSLVMMALRSLTYQLRADSAGQYQREEHLAEDLSTLFSEKRKGK